MLRPENALFSSNSKPVGVVRPGLELVLNRYRPRPKQEKKTSNASPEETTQEEKESTFAPGMLDKEKKGANVTEERQSKIQRRVTTAGHIFPC